MAELSEFTEIYKREVRDNAIEKIIMRASNILSMIEKTRLDKDIECDSAKWSLKQMLEGKYESKDSLAEKFIEHFNNIVTGYIKFKESIPNSTFDMLSEMHLTPYEKRELAHYLFKINKMGYT